MSKMIVIKNISTSKTLQVNDLGNSLIYGYKPIAQSLLMSPNEVAFLRETDEVKSSIIKGDIKKFVDAGDIQILEGTAYTTNQIVLPGIVPGALGLLGVVGVVSILAFVAATGAPAAKTLLDLTTDYTVANGDITLVTDQSLNNLVITYLG
jgi:hypothetical protein